MISVLIVLSQDRGLLTEAVESVQNQTFRDWELVIQRGPHLRSRNVNEGILKCKGEYIKLLDDDDLLPANCLADLHEGIQGYDWVCGDGQSFGLSDYLYHGRIPELRGMLQLNHIHGGTTMYRKELFHKVGGFDETLWTCEEYDFHLKLINGGYRCNYVPKTVHLYRIHEGSKSRIYNFNRRKERIELREKIQNRYR